MKESVWIKYNWENAKSVNYHPGINYINNLEVRNINRSIFMQMYKRRSRRFFENGMSREDVIKILEFGNIGIPKYLSTYLYIESVSEIEDGFYIFDGNDLESIGLKYDFETLSNALRGMMWIHGPGMILFSILNWKEKCNSGDISYFNIMYELGKFSQRCINKSSEFGYGGWMTPAGSENLLSSLLNLDGNELSPLYVTKIGKPAIEGY
ncbi:hypothetical protein [Vibrio penaeicida]|uniref:hypothetical protein n=1 Tax=Vibrio penaeicida TaxID=104609 RepID=UPI000CEA189B|nr:hypothetical protein [Vibrio penaeicida]